MSYSSLHCHFEWSNLRMLDCINRLEPFVKKAQEYNLNAIAVTDHESLSGWVKAIQLQKKLQDQGSSFKIILGDEVYLVDSLEEVRDNYQSGKTKFYHFILLAKDDIGAHQLMKLSSSAWDNYFKTGKAERVPLLKSTVEEVVKDNPGHLIAQTACMGGELAYWILNNNMDKCHQFINWCQKVFLPGNFFLEMQPSDDPFQIKINKTIVDLNKQTGIPYIVTTDCHYLTKDMAPVHEAFLKSRDNEDREAQEFYKTCYLMTAEEIHSWMDDSFGSDVVDTALSNTNVIADMIEFIDLQHSQVVPKVEIPPFELEESFKKYYPSYPYIEKFATSEQVYDRYFLYLVEEGWWNKEYREDLTSEEFFKMLNVINLEMEAIWESSININDNIASYYITALAIEELMWDDSEDGGNSFVGVSRGSIASFYTAYLIGLQQINPLKYDIPYWRHLHKSRPEMPDVDIDSEKSKRGRILEATKKKFGYDKVLNICAFKTEGPKSALATAGRGLNISNDEVQYLKDLIPVVRGKVTPLEVMINGDDDNPPNTEFINECEKYPRLLKTALGLEGLISGRTIHASGLIIFETPYTDLNCMMRSPNKQPTTQWEMDDSTYCGGLKYDFLTIKNLDAMHKCLDFLVEYGYIEWQGSLKATYDKYLHPDVINYTDPKMWEKAGNLEFVNLFQFMTAVGQQAIQKIKPKALVEMFVANAVMRLMATDGGETPLDTYVRYKNDIKQWYQRMDEYGLNKDEVAIMEKYLAPVYGMATMQEEVMKLVMDSNITNFDMKNANYTRKSIAKKKKKLQEEVKKKFYDSGLAIGTRKQMLDYVWKECITPQLGYSFSLPHIAGYSTIAVQEMNEAYYYPIIYWNTANLIVDSASDEETEGATDYGKIGVAIANMQRQGVSVSLPLINEAKFGFVPDEKNNRIIYALKGMNGIGDDVAKAIVDYAPYESIEQFCSLLVGKTSKLNLVGNAKMIQLIKGGCFTELHDKDRVETMKWFIRNYLLEPVSKLTMSQLGRAIEFNIIPETLAHTLKVINFKQYVLDEEFLVEKYVDPKRKMVKAGYHDRYFLLDENSQPFFMNNFGEDSIVRIKNDFYVISENKFTKEADSLIQPLKDWFATEEALNAYNEKLFERLWEKHAVGTIPHWNMKALSYYEIGQHELQDIDEEKYGIVNFFELPEEPEPYDWYTRYVGGEPKKLPKHKISCIAGTVLDKNKDKHTFSLLTKYGVVQVKCSKGSFAYYNKRISLDNKVLEEGWFQRGTLLRCVGLRDGDNFKLKKYADTIYTHTLNKITTVSPSGNLELQYERMKGESSDE